MTNTTTANAYFIVVEYSIALFIEKARPTSRAFFVAQPANATERGGSARLLELCPDNGVTCSTTFHRLPVLGKSHSGA
ncbi:hypothetical protein [Hymenobacter terrenus]|uniref:hypothetical protein n=1 Tax=Hymenobacter terrenus TaxID=1629124 RepID=UPI000B2AF2D9|nr:hypothetical protein [Hymenobacter terrenus]